MADFSKKFDSNKQSWDTPQDLFDKLNTIFHFETDLAASEQNTKCSNYFTQEDNSLTKEWKGICWLNPPYGDKNAPLWKWLEKSYLESEKFGSTIVVLCPARTNTNWWMNYCMKAKWIFFIIGRPKFGDCDHGLPQPLALIVFEKHEGNTEYFPFVLKEKG